MPKISERGKVMPASPIRRLVPYAEEAIRRGIKVYHLNIGQPDIFTPEVAMEALKKVDKKIFEYSHSAGNESYRIKLAAYYHSIGIEVDSSEILITTGGSEAILFSFLACLDHGDEVICPEPFYTNYNGFAAAAGINIKPITSYIENGFALPPMEDFEKGITGRTKGIILCNPNNPTGYAYSKEELEKLRKILIKYDLFLFADEVYRDFCYDGRVHHSVMNLEGVENHVILVDSVSKRYSSCGIRIGALISRNKKVISTILKFGQSRLSPPELGQIVAEAALDSPPEYYKGAFNEYLARRNYLIEALNKIEGVYSPMPGGAFYTIVRLPIDDCERFCQWMLEEFNYKNQTVMFAPATGFYATKGLGHNEVRIAYVLKVEDLKNAMECLAEALKVYPGRTL